MAITIREVAKKARVAVGTVSRVINGKADVDPKLRTQVERAIHDLGYRPNVRARNLSRNSSPILSFILSNRSFVHLFHSHILQGVEEYCSQNGYFVIFTKFDYSRHTKPYEIRLPTVLQSHGVADCVIAAGTNYDNFLEALDTLRMNYVLLANNLVSDNPRPPLDQVRFDDITGAQEATQHLIQLGHRDIWFVGDTTLPWCRTRNAGYLRAMGEAALEPHSFTAGLADDQFMDGLRSLEFMIDQQHDITAVLAGTDDIAYGAWEGIHRAGLKIPEDVSLIGFDDQYGTLRFPQLTTVRVKTEELGRELAKMAIAKIQSGGGNMPEVVIPTQLLRRGTCQPVTVRSMAF
jgi:DNA-binding LacI/PurR family transcriptional regulator